MIYIQSNFNYFYWRSSSSNNINKVDISASLSKCRSQKYRQNTYERFILWMTILFGSNFMSSTLFIHSSSSWIRYFAICMLHIFSILIAPKQTHGGILPPARSIIMDYASDDFVGANDIDGVDACCRRYNVPDVCRQTLCHPQRPPNDFEVYDVFDSSSAASGNCSSHLKPISHCLASGRDHSACCENEAKDGDEHMCFSMCRGKDRCVFHEGWNQYQACLAINIRSMFSCFVSGYANAPTPPRRLSLKNVATNSAKLTWQEPAINSQLVTRYIIYIVQLNEDDQEDAIDNNEELYFETDETRIELGLLESGTRYRASAVALTDGTNRSLRSRHIDFQTIGVAPRVSAFKSIISSATNASSVLLACKYKVSGVTENSVDIKWRFRKNSSKNFLPLQHTRFNQTSYLYSERKPREFITTLEINAFNSDDFGTYQCIVSDMFDNGQAEVILRPAEPLEAQITSLAIPLSPIPPLTPLACCQTRAVSTRCLPMCGGSATTNSALSSNEVSSTAQPRRYVPRPFMPSNCSGDISKVLSCAMPEVDDSACCLREQVPRQCMYLCDSSLEPSNQMAPVCLEHVDAVVQCRKAGVDKRPNAVSGLKLVETGGVGIGESAPKVAFVSWKSSKGAEIYRVYWRKRSEDTEENHGWHQKSQIATNRKVFDADEIVVVAVNAYGASQASKIAFDADAEKWARVS